MSIADAVAHAFDLPPALGARRMLVVEDDRTTRTLLAAGLRSAGMEVEVASRLDEARKALGKGGVDLLLLDGLLPDGSGLDFVRELRSRGWSTRIVFLSSFFKDMKSFQALKRELKVEDIWHKPLAVPELVRRVQSLLGLRHG